MSLKVDEIIQAKGLTKQYQPRFKGSNTKKQVLEDINFSLSKGENLGIIGRNGSGKSTLLKILAGITYPTSGRILYKGKISALLEVGAGFHQELTGIENIMMAGGVLGMKSSEIKKKLNEIIEFTELENNLSLPLFTYSTGMKLRLGFAVSAFLDSNIMLIDEALAVGDYNFQLKCLQKLSLAKEEGKTFVLVSHNINIIKSNCDKVLFLDGGVQKFFGKTAEGISNYLNNDIKKISINKDELKKLGYNNDELSFKIDNIYIQSTNLIEDKFISSEEIRVVIEIQSIKTSNNPIVYLKLVDSEDTNIITTLINDYKDYFVLQQGYSELICIIPPSILAENRYWLTLGLILDNQTIEYKRILSFDTKFQPFNNNMGFQFENASLRPKFTWVINES